MRMIDVNILTQSNPEVAREAKVQKYFCVSTDKAANPVNMMGGSKRIMEMFICAKACPKIFPWLDLLMLPSPMGLFT